MLKVDIVTPIWGMRLVMIFVARLFVHLPIYYLKIGAVSIVHCSLRSNVLSLKLVQKIFLCGCKSQTEHLFST
jgi:hypothetical protein